MSYQVDVIIISDSDADSLEATSSSSQPEPHSRQPGKRILPTSTSTALDARRKRTVKYTFSNMRDNIFQILEHQDVDGHLFNKESLLGKWRIRQPTSENK